jgi:DNA-binding PadR family transcriptional regulator
LALFSSSRGGEGKAKMAGKKCKGTPLKVFSGKQAKLNRIITLLYRSSKTPLTKYDIYKQIHNMKGYKHFDSRTVYRRINALIGEGLIAKVGSRPGQVEGESVLYELTRKGKASLRADEKSMEVFLQTATEEKLLKFLDLW